jgi:amino acid permease
MQHVDQAQAICGQALLPHNNGAHLGFAQAVEDVVFDGIWVDGRDRFIATISGADLQLHDRSISTAFAVAFEKTAATCEILFQGTAYKGLLHSDGQLHWDDGDIWSRATQVDRTAEHETNRQASASAITLNIIAGGLGSAIFSLPWSMAGTSILSGIVIVAVVLWLNYQTIGIVVRAAEQYQVFDLGSVIRQLPGGMGKLLAPVTDMFIWASMFLCLVSYLIVIHDSAMKFEFVKTSFLSNRLVLVAITSGCVLPLCFLSQRILAKTSGVAIAVNVYLFALLAVLFGEAASTDSLPEGSCIVGETIRGNFSMITVMFQAVIIQMCVLPMYKELENRSPQKFDKVVAVGFEVLFLIFCGFSTLGYLFIGPKVKSNILEDLPHNVWADMAQVGSIVVVACVYPIMVYPMIAPLHGVSLRGLPSRTVTSVAKVAIVVTAMLTAFVFDSLGFVNVVNGAMCAGIFVALVPSVVGLFLLDGGVLKKAALVVLMVGGLIVAGSGFFFSDNYVEDLACHIKL